MHKHSEKIINGFNSARTDFRTKIIRRWAWSIKRFIDQDHQPLLLGLKTNGFCSSYYELNFKVFTYKYYNTSGASEIIFKYPRSLNSLGSAPNILLPRGFPLSFCTITAALS